MILQISCFLANTFSLIQFHLSLAVSLDLAIFRLIPQPHALSRYSDIGPRVVALVDNRGQRLVSAVFNKNQNAQTTDLILIYQVRLAQ